MRNGYIDDDGIRRKLLAELRQGATRNQLARQLGISRPFLSQFLTRARQHASKPMLRKLRLEETRYYKFAHDD